MWNCKVCGAVNRDDDYVCKNCGGVLKATKHKKDEDFGVSCLVSAVTDSTLAGFVLGGSLEGAILGDLFDGDLSD